jgi:hypothetical protein
MRVKSGIDDHLALKLESPKIADDITTLVRILISTADM